MVRFGVGFSLVALGCSPASQPASEPGRDSADSPRSGVSPPSSDTGSLLPEAPARSNAPASSSAPNAAPTTFAFERLETTPVVSLAFGHPPKVAALALGEVLVFGGDKTVRIPAPDARPPEVSAEVFFGRDDQPRLMGSLRLTSGKMRPYYRRYRGGRFGPEPSELGPLAGDGPLYGVLGHEDPEVVCSPARFCLVKRVQGWGRAPAHVEPVRIVLATGTAFALGAERVERLERDVWVPLVPERTFETPVSLSVEPMGATWIVEAKRDTVTRLVNAHWDTIASPVRGARAILANAADDVWLVGTAGVAHFDGRMWRGVPGVPGPLAFVARSGATLWLAGEAGVFRGAPPKKD